jgi:hypothetical protein
MQKNQEGFIADFQKMRTSQKPSWFNSLHAKKPRRFYFRLTKKIRSSQKPSWFDSLHAKKPRRFYCRLSKK